MVKVSLIKFREKIPTSSRSTSRSAVADRATQTALLSPAVSPDCPHSPAAASSPQRQDDITLFPPQSHNRKKAENNEADCSV